jgi:hypothetical protein
MIGFYDIGMITMNMQNNFSGAPEINALTLKGAGLSFGMQTLGGLTAKATWARRIGKNPNPSTTGTDQDGTLNINRVWLNAIQQF